MIDVSEELGVIDDALTALADKVSRHNAGQNGDGHAPNPVSLSEREKRVLSELRKSYRKLDLLVEFIGDNAAFLRSPSFRPKNGDVVIVKVEGQWHFAAYTRPVKNLQHMCYLYVSKRTVTAVADDIVWIGAPNWLTPGGDDEHGNS